jgi:hypothetical protein
MNWSRFLICDLDLGSFDWVRSAKTASARAPKSTIEMIAVIPVRSFRQNWSGGPVRRRGL